MSKDDEKHETHYCENCLKLSEQLEKKEQEIEILKTQNIALQTMEFDENKELKEQLERAEKKLEKIEEKCKEYNFSTDIYDESDILAGEILQIIEGK